MINNCLSLWLVATAGWAGKLHQKQRPTTPQLSESPFVIFLRSKIKLFRSSLISYGFIESFKDVPVSAHSKYLLRFVASRVQLVNQCLKLQFIGVKKNDSGQKTTGKQTAIKNKTLENNYFKILSFWNSIPLHLIYFSKSYKFNG